MSWAQTVRQWLDELFPNRLAETQAAEITYLRATIDNLRIDKNLLQERLNAVIPAGQIIQRRDNPPKKPAQADNPTGGTRWEQLVVQRNREIAEDRKKQAEQKSQAAAT